jgi:hypothetical protein
MKTSRIVSFGLLLAVGGCLTQEQHAYPLYAGVERPHDRVGILMGPIAEVDGRDMSGKGKSFALLPGCHTFRLVRTTGQMDNISSGYVTTLPQAMLWLMVDRGHYYTFETTIHDTSGPVNAVSMGIVDHQSDGSMKPARGCNG